jgi:hypothetical protein
MTPRTRRPVRIARIHSRRSCLFKIPPKRHSGLFVDVTGAPRRTPPLLSASLKGLLGNSARRL